MTRHYPDRGSASDRLCRMGSLISPTRSTTKILVVSHQYGISALVSQTSFGGEASGSVAIAWNSLPDSIKKSSSLECFKNRLRSSKDLINSISYNKESSMIRNRNEEFLY